MDTVVDTLNLPIERHTDLGSYVFGPPGTSQYEQELLLILNSLTEQPVIYFPEIQIGGNMSFPKIAA